MLLWGSQRQAHNIYRMLSAHGFSVDFIFDPFNKAPIADLKASFSSDPSELSKMIKEASHFVTCIGDDHGLARAEISKALQSKDLKPLQCLDESVHLERTASLGAGLQAMPRSVVSYGTKIGDWCLLNTSATIDHDCVIGEGVHIMGSAAISGNVQIGDYAVIGTNATVLPHLRIGANAYVGAGAVVLTDVAKDSVVVGNPAKELRTRARAELDLSIFDQI